ncbi:hypothetical protein M758_8G092700 [Ceratodon purpureus]|nr:hypothetical protein M758_8G092700 [Ceratodon purpureus]
MSLKLMFGRSPSMTLLVQLAAIVLVALSCVNGAKIDIINNCLVVKTICVTNRDAPVTCYVLNAGGAIKTIDVPAKWEAGVIWGFNGNSGSVSLGIAAKPQANLAEITVGAADGNDYYDISNVNAYNLPMRIAVTQIAGGGTPSGAHCTSIVCNIPYNDLPTFCKAPNKLTGAPGNGCYNTDGTGNVATDGTRAFKARCPSSYSYSKDDVGAVFNCNTGSNYQVVFCP